jgi:hypothetical protein
MLVLTPIVAFAHAFITHSTIFPSAKSQIEQIDNQLANQLENLLTDLSFKIKTGSLSIDSQEDLAKAASIIDKISSKLGSDKALLSKTIAFMLRDAVQSYRLSNGISSSQIDYENAVGLTSTAESKLQWSVRSS